eukprot:TRINITY_DN17223_c0_g1_i1.p1 TRINITY_DN17223_c0_g1~~TRINITY_DN17223_c0_g1_i1.p1  ORF type:complete len:904 (+),score=182.84 TRINITY_DN17223_c0_g1_i1:42-2753(+)
MELPTRLKDAILNGESSEVHSLLEQQPEWLNTRFSFKASNGKKMEGTPLAAALRIGGSNVMAVVKVLVGVCHADLETPTSFLAGSSAKRWSGPPIHDAVGNGNLDLVRYLIGARVSPRTGSKFDEEQGATLLWQASYNDCPSIVHFLLERGALEDLEVPAPWQDLPDEKLTPLHVAARIGSAAVVKVLVDAGACFDKEHLQHLGGSTPLRDAIERCHFDVVKLLVSHGATVPRRALFQFNNEVAIAAVAEGLLHASTAAVRGCLHPPVWLGMFLATPGRAPAFILDAVFQDRLLKYFDLRKQRRDASIAYFEDGELNFAEGCEFEEIDAAFKKREPLDREGLSLLLALGLWVPSTMQSTEDEVEHYASEVGKGIHPTLSDVVSNNRRHSRTSNGSLQQADPGHSSSWQTNLRRRAETEVQSITSLVGANRLSMAPAQVKQCILPDLLATESVLWALAHAPNEDIYDLPSCQAIIGLGWNLCWWNAALDTSLSVVLALLFAALTGVLVWQAPPDTTGHALAASITCVVTFNMFKEVMQMIGMIRLKKFARYASDINNTQDWFRIGITYGVVIWLYVEPDLWTRRSFYFGLLLSVVVVFRWFRVLQSFRAYEWVGEKTLAIERALVSSKMFVFIVLVMCIAFTNAYLALGLGIVNESWPIAWFESFMVIYRLGFLADLEAKVWNETVQDRKQIMAQLLAMVSGLIMSIVMMNIFIGVLSESYAQACKNRHRLFQRERARIALEHSIRSRAISAFCSCCCRRKRKEAAARYLWYCVKKKTQDAEAHHNHAWPVTAMARLAKVEALLASLQRADGGGTSAVPTTVKSACASSGSLSSASKELTSPVHPATDSPPVESAPIPGIVEQSEQWVPPLAEQVAAHRSRAEGADAFDSVVHVLSLQKTTTLA